MRDIKEITGLLLGFIPWLLLLFLARGGLANLKVAILVSLTASLVFGLSGLRKGFLLSWGSLVFFGFAAIAVNRLNLIWVARHMDILANTTLASLMWGSILRGTPFALQFARQERPREQWNDPQLFAGSRWISLVWAWLMTLSLALSLLRRSSWIGLPEWFYPNASTVVVLTGLVITILFKRTKRLQRERLKI
jgi:hypothetical protein